MFTFKYIRYSVSNVSWYSDLSRLRASLRIQTIPILWHDRHNHEFNLLFCILGRWRTDLGQSNLRKTTSAFRQYSPFWFWCCLFLRTFASWTSSTMSQFGLSFTTYDYELARQIEERGDEWYKNIRRWIVLFLWMNGMVSLF